MLSLKSNGWTVKKMNKKGSFRAAKSCPGHIDPYVTEIPCANTLLYIQLPQISEINKSKIKINFELIYSYFHELLITPSHRMLAWKFKLYIKGSNQKQKLMKWRACQGLIDKYWSNILSRLDWSYRLPVIHAFSQNN